MVWSILPATGKRKEYMQPAERIARLRRTAHLLHEDGFGRHGLQIDFSLFMSMSQRDAEALLRDRLQHQIKGLSILDTENPLGIFNEHADRHLRSVSYIAQALLDETAAATGVPVSTNERIITTAIAYVHDLGNNVDRDAHGELSAKLIMPRIFTNYDVSDPAWRSIHLGIRLHDESIGVGLEDFAQLARMSPPVYARPIWAAIAADKLDVGQHRLSSALHDRMPTTFVEIVEQTPHTLVALYAQDSDLIFSPRGTAATWNITFSTNIGDVNEQTQTILRQFIWKNGDMYVPQRWHHAWRDRDIPYSVSYLGNMRMLYCTRVAIMLSCLFALFPQLETFELVVYDPKTYISTKTSTLFRRNNWQEVLFMIWKKTHRNTYRSGEISVPPLLAKGEREYKERKGYTV